MSQYNPLSCYDPFILLLVYKLTVCTRVCACVCMWERERESAGELCIPKCTPKAIAPCWMGDCCSFSFSFHGMWHKIFPCIFNHLTLIVWQCKLQNKNWVGKMVTWKWWACSIIFPVEFWVQKQKRLLKMFNKLLSKQWHCLLMEQLRFSPGKIVTRCFCFSFADCFSSVFLFEVSLTSKYQLFFLLFFSLINRL